MQGLEVRAHLAPTPGGAEPAVRMQFAAKFPSLNEAERQLSPSGQSRVPVIVRQQALYRILGALHAVRGTAAAARHALVDEALREEQTPRSRTYRPTPLTSLPSCVGSRRRPGPPRISDRSERPQPARSRPWGGRGLARQPPREPVAGPQLSKLLSGHALAPSPKVPSRSCSVAQLERAEREQPRPAVP